MIKIEDLKAGETVLEHEDGYFYKVLDVFKWCMLESPDNESVPYSISEINKYFTIKQPKAQKIPEVGNYYETLPKVRYKDENSSEWKEGKLIEVVQTYPCFYIIKKDAYPTWFDHCELIED